MMSEDNHSEKSGLSGIVIYQSPDGCSAHSVRLEGKTVWLTQAQMADLFQRTRTNITIHVGNVLEEGELTGDSVCKDYLHTAADGKRYQTRHYSIDI